MRALFERTKQNGFSALEQAVAERQQENVGLDFKEKADANNGQLTRDDRQMLAENLSAFANSAGGLLVIGVEARKDADGVDAAVAVRPIKELSRLQTEVLHAVGELLLPRHDGVLVHPVPIPHDPDMGCLAIWVERSERRPHQSQAAKDRRYYKRAGDSTYVMEHYDIEDAFRRAVTPSLKLELETQSGSGMGGPFGSIQAYNFVFSLRNDSPVTARFPYLHFVGLSSLHISRRAAHPWKLREQGDRLLFDGGANDVIHPDQVFVVATAELGVLTEGSDKYLLQDPVGPGRIEDLRRVPILQAAAAYSCVFGAENCRMQRTEQIFNYRELHDLIGI
jgi:schlafen family protein